MKRDSEVGHFYDLVPLDSEVKNTKGFLKMSLLLMHFIFCVWVFGLHYVGSLPARCLQGPEEGVRSPRTGVTNSCEAPNLGLLKE